MASTGFPVSFIRCYWLRLPYNYGKNHMDEEDAPSGR
jgi:hypothetical protein